MNLNSLLFLIFVVVSVIGYYLVPKKVQWVWLLAMSYVYYAAGGVAFLGYLAFTTISTFVAAYLVEKTESKGKKKAIMLTGVILNFGLLGILKYSDFVIANINKITGSHIDFWSLAIPIGISFYIFQSMGYLLDVYWKRIEAEKNIFRFALFVSFFPQILQGPIGRYSRLAHQLYESRKFDFAKLEQGVLRILWGFFKKLILADTAAIFVTAFFDEYEKYPGTAIFAVLMYSIQLYADFSGGIDIVIGIAKLFGIEMDENFKQPFFAVSITDFWHRWHITLGTWMKDYVFYPVSLSKWMSKFGKWARKHLGRKVGRTLPICIANLIVFFVVGVWHGAEWRYIVYGMYNGLIIAISGLLADQYKKWKKKLHINDKAFGWTLFCIIRTFILVNISWFFDRAHSVKEAVKLFLSSFTSFHPENLLMVPVGNAGETTYTLQAILIMLLGLALVFIHSLLKERGMDTVARIQSKPAVFRVILIVVLFLSLAGIGQLPSLTGGFIYAQF